MKRCQGLGKAGSLVRATTAPEMKLLNTLPSCSNALSSTLYITEAANYSRWCSCPVFTCEKASRQPPQVEVPVCPAAHASPQSAGERL